MIILGTITDLAKRKPELLVENALLRQQLVILHRHVKRPVYRKTDRFLLVLLARMVRTWKQALFIGNSYTNWWKQRACRKQEIC